MEELEYNPLLSDEQEPVVEIKMETPQPARSFIQLKSTGEPAEKRTRNKPRKVAVPHQGPSLNWRDTPIAGSPSASQWPSTNPVRYTPPQDLPDPNLFTRQMIPVDDQKKDEDLPFIHLDGGPDQEGGRLGDAVTISQKLEEKLNQMENQNSSSKRFLRESINGIPNTTVFQPMYMSPFRFPLVAKLLEVPYEEVLQIMKIPHQNFKRDKTQVVPREYEVEFRREPVGSERPCVNDSHCVARQMPSAKDKKITLREYYLPDHYRICKERGCWPDDRQECLLCMFYAIAKKYFNVKGDQTGIEGDASIASFVHLVGVPGEYCIENCIGTTEKRFMGLWGPIYLFKLTDWDLKRIKVNCQINGKFVEEEVWGFDLNIPFPVEGNTLFFHRGSLVPRILEKFAHLSIQVGKGKPLESSLLRSLGSGIIH